MQLFRKYYIYFLPNSMQLKDALLLSYERVLVFRAADAVTNLDLTPEKMVRTYGV